MTENEEDLIPMEDHLPAAEEAAGKKPGLVRGARDFIGNTFATLKGKDMNQAVEEFTSEMTLVAEGLSEDLAVLRQDADKLSAQQTLLEERLRRNAKEAEAGDAEALEAIRQQGKRADEIEKRVEALEKKLKETEKKPPKMGLGQILRQATWMVGIFCAAWVIVTLLNLLRR